MRLIVLLEAGAIVDDADPTDSLISPLAREQVCVFLRCL
jgi:hypothetical protein